MNSKLAIALVICGTLCILATLGVAAYLIKQLSPMLATSDHIRDNHMLLVSVAACPGIATFLVGVILLVIGLRRSVGRGDAKGHE
jgi:O-antigen/teichoic acid export membrane protein